ncbi:hypothetical protein CHELA20_53633 [Hyphomicrobiales bacterium]|nr:hypothetical protein CHELA41_21295 [Hyphomicrobiales bacterium]CAH1684640.1 hypothetical protein CHELA20_53633 [Hyphomicrobiales bacterium]
MIPAHVARAVWAAKLVVDGAAMRFVWEAGATNDLYHQLRQVTLGSCRYRAAHYGP